MLRPNPIKALLTERRALHGLLLFFLAAMVFHALALVNVIPSALVWGGRLHNHAQLMRFEAGSLTLTLLLLAVVAVQAGYVKIRFSPRVMTVVFSLMFLLFLLNTAGNLTSPNAFEKWLFTPLTLVLALLTLRVAVSNSTATSDFVD